MEKTATNAFAALAAVIIVVATWAPIVTVPAAGEAAALVAPPLA